MSDPTLEELEAADQWALEEAERIAAAVSSRRWLSEKELEAVGVRPKGAQK